MDKEKLERLFLAVRSGTDLETSCQYAGFAIRDLYRYLEIGRVEAESIADGNEPDDSKQEYLELWEGLKMARADSIVRNVAAIQNAASSGSWQAAAWWLERTMPEQYSKTAVDRKATGANSGLQLNGG